MINFSAWQMKTKVKLKLILHLKVKLKLIRRTPKSVEIDTTSAWDHNKTDIAKPGRIVKLSTEYDRKLKAGKKKKKTRISNENRTNKHSK